MNFLTCPIFVSFVKITSNIKIDIFFIETLVLFRDYRKTKNTITFSIIKLIIYANITSLRLKLTSEMCQKVCGWIGKMMQNSLKMPKLSFFFSKNSLFLKVNTFRFSIIKILMRKNFMRLWLKMTSEIHQKAEIIDLKSVLKDSFYYI